MVVHFLAGVCVGMVAILFWYYRLGLTLDVWKMVQMSILSVFIIGILWEIYELYFDITSFSDGMFYVTDTISDIIMDISGGFLGSLYAIRTFNKKI